MLLNKVYSNTRNRRNNQQGVYLILMTVGIVLVLALAGLIIDAVKLYRARLRMQNAADAGVIAGLSFRVIKGPTTPKSEITAEAERIINSNLALFAGEINDDPSSHTGFNFDYNPKDVSLAVEYTRNINLFMLNLIPWGVFQGLGGGGLAYQNGVPVRVNAQSQIGVANVALMLDVSGSMACPGNGNVPNKQDCYNYIDKCNNNFASLGFSSAVECITQYEDNSRIAQLKTAATAFIEMFTAGRDRISLITYNTGARVDNDIDPPIGSFDDTTYTNNWGALPGIIKTLSAFGNTNPSSALLEAYRSMNLAGVFNDEQAWYVLFTDGAPTAGRFLLQPSPKDEAINHVLPWDDGNVYNRLHSFDFMNFKVTWNDTDNNLTFPGPSQLYQTRLQMDNLVPIYDEHDNIVLDKDGKVIPSVEGPRQDNFYKIDDDILLGLGNNEKPDEIPPCSELTYPTVANDYSDAAKNAIGCNSTNEPLGTCNNPCLKKNFRYMNPRFRSYGDGSSTGGPFGGTIALIKDQLFQQYYDVTISIADYLRANRGTFFTIGLGQAAPDNSGDPYQDANNDESRKDRFLARLAFDPYAYDSNRLNLTGLTYLDQAGIRTDFGLNYDHDHTIATWAALGATTPYTAPNRGYYYPTPNAAELQLLFTQAARRILLRLIQ